MLHLGVPKNVSDSIEQKYEGIERQKEEAISWWMNNSTTASPKILAEALMKIKKGRTR